MALTTMFGPFSLFHTVKVRTLANEGMSLTQAAKVQIDIKRLCKEVQRYPCLYDLSSRDYTDTEKVINSWKEIAQNLGVNESACRLKWKSLREKFVRARKKLHLKRRSGTAGKLVSVPRIYSFLGWLSAFVRHRDLKSTFPEKAEEGSDTVTLLQDTVDITDSWHYSILPPPVTLASSPTEGSPSPLSPSSSASTTAMKKPLSTPTEDFIQNQVQEIKNSKDQSERRDLESRLPLSSLNLLVPPLRLMSACMWQVAQERNVEQYEKLAGFISLVTEMVPDLLGYKQKTQLILGLRARLILEMLKKMNEGDFETYEHLLDSFQQRTTNRVDEQDQDGEVEISKSAFVDLVQTLFSDRAIKEHFFKEVFPIQYGARFDTALQILVWEFFYRLEEFFPVPSFSKVSSMFDFDSLDCKFEKFVPNLEDLKKLLQHQKEQQAISKSTFAFTSDTILSVLASQQTSVTSGDHLYQRIQEGGMDDQQNTETCQDMSENKTAQQENGCSVEVLCDDGKETDDSWVETNPNARQEEYELSPLSCSPCSEGAGETAVEVTFWSSRCSESLMKGMEEHLDLCGIEESAEESTIHASTVGTADASAPFSKNTSENICPECGKTFPSQAGLKYHYLTHSSVNSFKCTYCNKAYRHHKDLKYHVVVHTDPGASPIACHLCSKRFNNHSSHKVHLLHHSGERPHPCPHCNKRFLTKSVLKSHVRIHTGERPYTCPICSRKFTQNYPLTVHLRMHRQEKPYLCSTCGMSFCSSGALLVHSRYHTGERPYSCEFCKKRFPTAGSLTQHRRSHTGERPYPCSQCDKMFSSCSGLKKHMSTHTGEKPHKCVTCHKTFSQKSNLKIHLKVHKNI